MATKDKDNDELMRDGSDDDLRDLQQSFAGEDGDEETEEED